MLTVYFLDLQLVFETGSLTHKVLISKFI